MTDKAMTTEKPAGSLATVQQLLEQNKKQILMALPKHLSLDRLVRMSLTAIQKNPKLLECAPATLGGAVMMCAIWGVEPIGAGGAYLVPFFNNKKGRYEVQFIIDYRGLAKIAKNSGEVSKIEWHPVHAKDSFSYQYGTEPKINHIPYQGAGDAGPLTHVYAIGFLKDGSSQFVVMTKDEALKAKARSKSKDSGPWQTDEEEMCLKTSVRKLSKQLPMDPEKQSLVSLEERGDIGIPQDLGTLIDPTETPTDSEEEKPEPIKPPQRASEKKPEPIEAEAVKEEAAPPADFYTFTPAGVTKKASGKGHRYSVKAPDGSFLSTFSDTDGANLIAAEGNGQAVKVSYAIKGDYKNITAVELAA